MAYKYSFEKFEKETMARACANNVAISMKKSVETARSIRGKKLSSVMNFLERVAEKKAVVPYKRYISEMPHRRGKGLQLVVFLLKYLKNS